MYCFYQILGHLWNICNIFLHLQKGDNIVSGNTSLPALPTCVAWQPSSKLSVAVGTEAGHLLLLDLRNLGAPSSSSIKCHERGVHKIVFAPERYVPESLIVHRLINTYTILMSPGMKCLC